jgi:uncharacterized protein YciI
MAYFFLKALPPRASFSRDMSETERACMKEHVAYWTDLTEKGIAVLFGPVQESEGFWGAGVVEVADESEARSLIEHDPTYRANLLKFEMYPMRVSMIRKEQSVPNQVKS